MKELLKSKSILLFIIIMMGVMFVGAPESNLEKEEVKNDYLTYNLK